nr:M14 family metallopeptidase [Chitinophagaceae bacterium]
ERIKLQVTGTTYEGRQQVLLIITSQSNHNRIDEIRKQHLQLCDPSTSGSLDLEKMPAVLLMGYSIHGNESSGANASLLAAYHLAAAQGKEIEDLLNNTVILLDPSFNPDGLQRFSTWANQHKSKHLVTDPNSREFNEVWPGGRFNHYWFDLNRDWLPAVHVESRNRLKYFHDWRPNVLTDHHEMGTNSTFFFQPGVPSRVNPVTPEKNQELTSKIGTFHAKYLDKIGSLYFTKEGYDDFYYGKGSTFPDIHGAVGILFEQASSRGHAQESANGLLTFPFTIRNQFYTTLSTMEAVGALRKELLQFQRESFKSAVEEAKQSGIKGYVFGNKFNSYNADVLAEMLQRHRVDVRILDKDFQDGKQTFEAGKSYFIPAEQPQYRLVKTVFEKVLNFKDSLFYDVTAWTMPLAMGVNYTETKMLPTSKPAELITSVKGSINGSASDYGWVIDWRDFEAAAALYKLQSKKIITRLASRPFSQTVNGKIVEFPPGSIIIPSQLQTLSKQQIFEELSRIVAEHRISITGISSGLSLSGIDAGSGKAISLEKPGVAMLVGTGVTATDAGEVWHLLDQRLGIPATHLEIPVFNRADLSRYNTLIMVSGSHAGLNKEKLKAWVESGGLLIACEDAVQWCANNGITKVKFKRVSEAVDSTKMLRYADREEVSGAQRMNGAIFRADADATHPLCFGYTNPYIDLFKTNDVFIQPASNPYAAPVRFGNNPLQSGYITAQNYNALKGSASVLVQTVGQGRVIHFADNPNFRAFWLGSMRLFVNAIFFGRNIDAASSRAED